VLVRLAILVSLLLASTARAEPCVNLDGDATLIAAIGRELVGRGIGLEGDCPRMRVERRGEAIVVSIVDPSREPIERSVREVPTAAAVIESFVRSDVGSPLLAIRAPSVAEIAVVKRAPVVERAPIVESAAPKARPALPTGAHWFAGLETSLATDGTHWNGFQLGGCAMLGPLCLGGRTRGAVVVSDGMVWDQARRKSFEVLASVDVPLSAGRFLLMPGVAAGLGPLMTKPSSEATTENNSNNLRAEVHVSLSVPLTRSLAFDFNLVGTLVQQIQRDPGYVDASPPEPLGFLRFGVAMRYGRR